MEKVSILLNVFPVSVIGVVCLFLASLSVEANIDILVRYDDLSISSNTAVERQLFEAVGARGGSVLAGVIPFWGGQYPDLEGYMPVVSLTPEKREFLRQSMEKKLVEVALHGYLHVDARRNAGYRSEFAGVSLERQERILAWGKSALEEALGTSVDKLIPPFNTYDENTVLAMRRTGYGFLSAAPGGVLPSVPVSSLPSTMYVQNFRQEIKRLSARNADVLAVITLHPYDLVGSGEPMPNWRGKAKQVSIGDLVEDFKWAESLGNVGFVSVEALSERHEDLSVERYIWNSVLRENPLINHRLVPEFIVETPSFAGYYTQSEAIRILLLYLGAAALVYGGLTFAGFWASRRLCHGRFSRKRMSWFLGVSAMTLGMALYGFVVSNTWLGLSFVMTVFGVSVGSLSCLAPRDRAIS